MFILSVEDYILITYMVTGNHDFSEQKPFLFLIQIFVFTLDVNQ